MLFALTQQHDKLLFRGEAPQPMRYAPWMMNAPLLGSSTITTGKHKIKAA